MTKIYEIKLVGALDDRWSDWFSGVAIEVEPSGDGSSITTLTCPVADQAELRGIVSQIWDLNLTLISVTRIGAGRDRSHDQQGGEPWENS